MADRLTYGRLRDRAAHLAADAISNPAAGEPAGELARSSASSSWPTGTRPFSLRSVRSAGAGGEHLRYLARSAARAIDAATAPTLHGDTRALPAALRYLRPAILLLPDLAITGLRATNAMNDSGLLLSRRESGGYSRIKPYTLSALTGGYRAALQASRRTVAAHLAVDLRHPQRARAAHVARHIPSERPLPNDLGALATRTPSPPRSAGRAIPWTSIRVEASPTTTRITGSDHGQIEVPNELLHAALIHTADHLRTILASRIPDRLYGNEQLIVLAALAAEHAPEAVTDQAPPFDRFPGTRAPDARAITQPDLGIDS